MSETDRQKAAARLNELLDIAGLAPLSAELAERFAIYLELLTKWNAKLNLTAIRQEDEILRRHFVECIFCALHLPADLTTVLDLGSGAGFPGIPIALCRPEFAVTLAESQTKKASFLREAVRTLGTGTKVHAGRAETLESLSFSCVTMRAVEKMAETVPIAERLLSPGGWLAVLISESDADTYRQVLPEFHWQQPIRTPFSEHGILLRGHKRH